MNNTGVQSPGLLHMSLYIHAKSLQSCPTLCDPVDCSPPTRLLCPWDSPGRNTGVGCCVLFQGIFLTQGLNPVFLHCRQILYHLSHQPGKIFLLLEVTNKITHTIYFYSYSATIIILGFIHVLYSISLIILVPHCETCLCFLQTFLSIDTDCTCLKYMSLRLQQYVNRELPDVQARFRKGRGTRDQIANICWIMEKKESSRKTSISALLTMPKPKFIVDDNKLWKILQEMGIPDHLTFLLRNLYAGQEATVRTDWTVRTWNRLVPNKKRSTSRLYIVTLLI